MSRIVEIESEIESIQTELNKLKQEQQQLEQSLPDLIDSPEEIAIAAKSTAVAFAERQPQLTVVMDAIALLERRLLSLHSELAALRKQQKQDVLESQRFELEPQLVQLAHRINQLSSEMDAVCAEYRAATLEYNRVRSELENQQVFPVTFIVTGVPYAITQADRGFNLKLGMKSLGTAVTFEQQPQPDVPQNFPPSMSQSLETRIALLKSSLSDLKNHRTSIADWGVTRIAVVEGQLLETEHQIKILEAQESTI